jgi:hypothetical protein
MRKNQSSAESGIKVSPKLIFSDPKVEPPVCEFVVQFDAWATKRRPQARRLVAKVLAKTRGGALKILKSMWRRGGGHKVISETPLEAKAA